MNRKDPSGIHGATSEASAVGGGVGKHFTQYTLQLLPNKVVYTLVMDY